MQIQTPGDKDFNVIRGQFQDLKTLSIINFQFTILNEYAIASFDSPTFAQKLVKSDNDAGNKNVRYAPKINSAIEKFPGKTRDEITKIIINKLNQLPGAKIKK